MSPLRHPSLLGIRTRSCIPGTCCGSQACSGIRTRFTVAGPAPASDSPHQANSGIRATPVEEPLRYKGSRRLADLRYETPLVAITDPLVTGDAQSVMGTPEQQPHDGLDAEVRGAAALSSPPPWGTGRSITTLDSAEHDPITTVTIAANSSSRETPRQPDRHGHVVASHRIGVAPHGWLCSLTLDDAGCGDCSAATPDLALARCCAVAINAAAPAAQAEASRQPTDHNSAGPARDIAHWYLRLRRP